MSELADTHNVLNLEAWNATETGVLSYIKTPIQQTFFTNNSDLIGKVLRQAIIYFIDSLNDIDKRLCIIGNEFRSTRTHKYQLSSSSNDNTSETTMMMEVTTFAPIAFEYMRTIIGITRNDFQSSFNTDELINFANTGKSGSQMYKTKDDVYVIKTLRDHEAKLLIQSLSGLYLRYSHTSSLMTRYIGLYSVSVRSVFPSEIYCVIMLNNLPSILDIHEIYDLKGSSVGRFSSIDLPLKRIKALKDLDFESFYPRGIRIPHEIYRRLKITMENDIFELRKLMITDFSLMLGVYQLDEYLQDKENINEKLKMQPKPQLGISSFMAAMSIDRTAIESNNNNQSQTNEKVNVSDPKLIKKFIMKPLHLITCPQEDTFTDNEMANSLLGIPGLTHDRRRVLLYPAFIDCLQTFDNFKRMQHAIQNIRDPKRGSEYSVIHPDEYEKRLMQFLFDKVFIDSNQTLDELLASPPLPDIPPQNQSSNEQHEPFEFIQTTEVVQSLTIQPLTTTDNGKMFIETTSL